MCYFLVVIIANASYEEPSVISKERGWFIFIDLDAFYASVEILQHPELKGTPMVVCMGSLQGRGVVSTASYEARKYGVHSGMPLRRAISLCPGLILVPAHHALYEEYSARVYALLKTFSERIQKVSIDEACLELDPHSEPEKMALAIQSAIKEKLGLPSTIGVASNKLVAKIACDLAKPNGVKVVPKGTEKTFLAPLPVEKIPEVGPATVKKLHTMGVITIDDLAKIPEEQLIERFGKRGRYFHLASLGIDLSPLELETRPRSMSREVTFNKDTKNLELLRKELYSMSQKLAEDLKIQGLVAKTVFIKLRYSDFSTLLRQLTLTSPTHNPLEIASCGILLLKANLQKNRAVRLIGLGVRNLIARNKTKKEEKEEKN